MWNWLLFGSFSIGILAIGFGISSFYNKRKIELDNLNTLYQCGQCGKFHRQYQEEIQIKWDNKYTQYHMCPNCYGPAQLYTGEIFPWMEFNPEYPKISIRDLHKIKYLLRKIEVLSFEDRSIEKFLYYYRLLQEERLLGQTDDESSVE